MAIEQSRLKTCAHINFWLKKKNNNSGVILRNTACNHIYNPIKFQVAEQQNGKTTKRDK